MKNAVKAAFIALAFFCVCPPATAQLPGPPIELKCPSGYDVLPGHQTFNASTQKFRQNVCVDVNGNVIQNPTGTNAAIKPAASDGIYFVSNNGNDTFEGRSWGSAFLTVAAAETACGASNQCKIFVASTFSGTVPSTPTSANISIIALGGSEWLNSGTFTDTQMNLPMTSSVNGLNFQTEFQAAEGLTHGATEAISGGIAVPSASSVLQANGLGGYTNNSSTTTFAFGGYFQSRCLANGTHCAGINDVAIDSGSLTSGVSLIGNDMVLAPRSVSTAYVALNGFSAALNASGSGNFGNAFIAASQNIGTSQFNYSFNSADGAATNAFLAGATCATGTCNSQPMIFDAYNSGTLKQSEWVSDSSGNMNLFPSATAILNIHALSLFSSGGGTILHQAPNTAGNFTQTDSPLSGSTVVNITGSVSIASGFGTTPSIVNQGAGSGPTSIEVNVGTGGVATSGVLTMPAAPVGWSCSAVDMNTNIVTRETAFTTTSVTLTAASAWTASDKLLMTCWPF